MVYSYLWSRTFYLFIVCLSIELLQISTQEGSPSWVLCNIACTVSFVYIGCTIYKYFSGYHKALGWLWVSLETRDESQDCARVTSLYEKNSVIQRWECNRYGDFLMSSLSNLCSIACAQQCWTLIESVLYLIALICVSRGICIHRIRVHGWTNLNTEFD
jgi:hypothetical protein